MPPAAPPEEDFTDHRFGVLHGHKPVIRRDGVYQFNSLDVEIVGGRRYLEVSVRNNQPVNWGVFQTRFSSPAPLPIAAAVLGSNSAGASRFSAHRLRL